MGLSDDDIEDDDDHEAEDDFEFDDSESENIKSGLIQAESHAPEYSMTVTGEGQGDFPQSGNFLSVHYVATLMDGSVFDSSRDRGKPFQFSLGRSQVI